MGRHGRWLPKWFTSTGRCLLLKALKNFHLKELLSAAYIGSIILLLTALVIFLIEQHLDNETNFASMGDALWWAFITFYSIGYGDITPVTWAGKLVASCCTVFGMIVFNLPSGIVGAGLALQVLKV